MRAILIGILVFLWSFAAVAENSTPYSGTVIVETPHPFDGFVERLKSAAGTHGMGIVAEACATCGAKSIGVTIPGNRIIMVFHPKFAVRMLKASEAAGVEAPLRLYVTERPGGMARLTYRKPSHVFRPYGVAALDEMAAELDDIVARIASDAVGG